MTKGKAFLLCWGGIIFVFISMFVIGVIKTNLDIIPVGACLTALCSITGGFIGFQVANNGIKGHNWNQDMFDSENKEVITGGGHDGTK